MSNDQFVHIHNHSYYSLLDGMSSPDELAKCAKNLGFKSLALTDHGTCAGLFNFYKACKKHEIKPILGMEAYVVDDCSVKEKRTKNNHLIILAKNKIGYKNLINLSSYGYINGFYYKPRIDFDILKEKSEGLIVTSACCVGEIPMLIYEGKLDEAKLLIEKYQSIFKDDFYLEVMVHEYIKDKEQEKREKNVSNAVYKLSKEMDVKCICSQDVHYALKDQWKVHDILLSVQTLDTIKNENRFTFDSKDFYMKPYSEMEKLYGKAPSLLKNTLEIAEKIEDNIMAETEDLLPSFNIPEGFKDDTSYLWELIENGMVRYGVSNNDVYRDRVNYEMEVIIRCKYVKYFLILWDIINFARKKGIRIGAGRGSAAGSLVIYLLGVTKLDPIKYGLLFERFLNPDRVSPPDVDVDFDYNRRHEVYEYVVEKYGTEYCSQISTYNSFKAKAAVKSTIKALDLGNDWEETARLKASGLKYEVPKNTLRFADRMSKLIPNGPNINIEGSMKTEREFAYYMQKYPMLIDSSMRLEGTLSSAGVHAAGIVICKDKIIDRVPLRVAKGVTCAQFDKDEVEEVGLLKFDLLAIKTLTMIENAINMAKARNGGILKDKDGKEIDIDDLEPNDPHVFEIFNGTNKKNTLGIFQFESPGMVRLLKDLHVDKFEDVVVAVALYRPGPKGAGVPELYCQYKHGRKKIQYLHPKMGEVLKDTYGMMIFQEDSMKIAKVLAGFTGGQADTLRKAIGKKKEDLLVKMKSLFIDGCVKNGIANSTAVEIFQQIEYFSGYGFNLAHAACYSYISYQTAWLKTYYPLEFMCSLLSNEIHNSDKDLKLGMYQNCALNMGIPLVKEHINFSGLEYKIDQVYHTDKKCNINALRKPLTGLAGVGAKAVANIVENQPYESLESFLRKINHRVVNSRVFKTLVESGCMSSAWKIDESKLLSQYEETKKKIDKDKKKKAKEDKMRKDKEDGQELLDEFVGEFDASGKDLTF